MLCEATLHVFGLHISCNPKVIFVRCVKSEEEVKIQPPEARGVLIKLFCQR